MALCLAAALLMQARHVSGSAIFPVVPVLPSSLCTSVDLNVGCVPHAPTAEPLSEGASRQ
jgi:hypothetical protein